MTGETICALSSARGRAGVAVIRVSGPSAGAALEAVTGRRLPAPRRATLSPILDLAGAALDRGLVLWFPAPASFTGEDMAELHVHGSAAVVSALLDTLSGQDGVRIARPGEFTRRAFENGKLDLTEAEGIADLIAAETEAQRKQALRALEGHIRTAVEGWRAVLVRALAHIEAELDFPDEGDAPSAVVNAVRPPLEQVAAAIQIQLNDRRGERLREGVRIALIGAPNAGKSSLMNALAGRDIAITADLPGTTRDVLEAALDLQGVPVRLFDTAGLRTGGDVVEAEGMRRARRAAEEADLRILVHDSTTGPALDPEAAALLVAGDIIALNKTDVTETAVVAPSGVEPIPVSALTGDGVLWLLAYLGERTDALAGAEGALITRARHREAFADCAEALRRCLGAHGPDELFAEDLRLAVRALGRVTGRVDVEDLLDVIFRDFCIGK